MFFQNQSSSFIMPIYNVKNKSNNQINANNTNKPRNISIPVNNSYVGQIPTTIQPQSNKNEQKKVMAWGEPMWIFFHSIAHFVSEEQFPFLRNELLNFIFSICSNLPCPTCSGHAIEYLNKTNFINIQTKQQLKDALFVFHNNVNKRKNYEMFEYSNLDEKYKRANFLNVVNNFINVYSSKTNSLKMISEDFHRSRLIRKFKNWIVDNIRFFVIN